MHSFTAVDEQELRKIMLRNVAKFKKQLAVKTIKIRRRLTAASKKENFRAKSKKLITVPYTILKLHLQLTQHQQLFSLKLHHTSKVNLIRRYAHTIIMDEPL
ncbi:unnamed protein product [Ceratitis capitata]|uniref:(Mediterranean fruit fly) hypothetical protein n=1 Tax=Ceratitis capitata TaxID=7213 RepID=A0A811UTS7_CERCA|nr:unnamed protein product [Ceratitis capitata]